MKLMKQYQNLPGLLKITLFQRFSKMADEFPAWSTKADGGAPVALPMIALTVLANNGGLLNSSI